MSSAPNVERRNSSTYGPERHRDVRMRRTAWSYLTGGVVATVVYALITNFAPGSTAIADSLLIIWFACVAAAAPLALRWQRPDRRWPWITLFCAVICWGMAAGGRSFFGEIGDLSAQRWLYPDILTVLGYGFFVWFTVEITRRRHGGRTADWLLLDSAIVGISALVVLWPATFGVLFTGDNMFSASGLVLAATIVASTGLVVVAAMLVFGPTRRITPTTALLSIGLIAIFSGDVMWSMTELGGVDLSSTASYGYLLAMAVLPAGVLHPELLRRHVDDGIRSPYSIVRGVLVAGAVLVPTSLLAQDPDGTVERWMRVGIVVVLAGLVAFRVFVSVRTQERAEADLERRANSDDLTGVANRRALIEQIDSWLELGVPVAVLFADLNRFKLVNDTFGHRVGDELLVDVAERLADTVTVTFGSSGFVGRLGGDEFVVVVALDDATTVDDVAETLLDVFNSAFHLEATGDIYLRTSIGVAVSEGDGNASELLRDADVAMYHAKREETTVTRFDAGMRSALARRQQLENALHEALERDEFTLVYQPIVDTTTRRCQGLETLLRWNPPGETVSPSEFIPVAEESGLIVPIGDWVLRTAARQLAAWRKEHPQLNDIYIAVNLSGRQLVDTNMAACVSATLTEAELDATDISLELTESVLIEERTLAHERVNELVDIGIRIGIDDFGTGYSSLSYLDRFPFTYVKIDRRFLTGHDHGPSALLQAVVAMSKALHLRTVAEGVETEDQLTMLERLGCDAVQGYYLCRPVIADAVPGAVETMARGRPTP